MKRFILMSALLSFNANAQSSANNEDVDSQRMASVRQAMQAESGNSTSYFFIAERLEAQVEDGDTKLLWEAQGWIGKDLERFWFKTEGTGLGSSKKERHSEMQFLYSKGVSPFWDLQMGWRHDFNDGKDKDAAVIGIQGLAPYWFAVDAAAFFGGGDNVSIRVEAEYDLYFTQRLIFQPRIEVNYAFTHDPTFNVGQGVNELNFGLRLRYEYKRTFAPYVGLNWSKAYGETAGFLLSSGQEREELSLVVGLRFWF